MYNIHVRSQQTKRQPEDSSRLFTLISENFAALFLTMEQNHKDEVYIVSWRQTVCEQYLHK